MAIHLVRTYLITNFSTPLTQYAPVHILDDFTQFPQLRTYLMDGLFFTKKINDSGEWNKHSGKQYKSKTQ